MPHLRKRLSAGALGAVLLNATVAYRLDCGPCDTGYRERYLLDRTLPEPGATCPAGVLPFTSWG